MLTNEVEVVRRTDAALKAIRRSFGTEVGEFGANLFVSHHLDELDQSYWQAHLKIDRPEPFQALELLCLQSHWGEDDDNGVNTFDFCLPGGVSDYLLSVRFNDEGEVDEISMES